LIEPIWILLHCLQWFMRSRYNLFSTCL